MITQANSIIRQFGICAFASVAAMPALADECTSLAPYLREIRESASASANSTAASAFYSSLLMDLGQRAESESSEGSIDAIGYGSANGKTGKNKSEVDYHVAASQSATASASDSSKWLREYSNTISASAAALVGQCLNRRGLDYKFVIGGDGKTFFIHATYRTPSTKLPFVTVRQVESGENVSCDSTKFSKIDAGGVILKCVRKNSGGDTVTIATDYDGSDSATFSVPDVRPRYREKGVNLDLTWCGAPGCAPDPSRQLAWSPPSTLAQLQPGVPRSCNLFDLHALRLLRSTDVLLRGQALPLQLISTQRGNWASIRQDMAYSAPISNHSIALCGTRAEPYDDWPNLYFQVRTQIRYLERLFY